jgi:putative hydrolase of the HAD superfamily
VSPNYTAVVAGVAASKGLDIDHDQADLLWRTWNLEGSFFGRRLFDDAHDMLAELRSRGLKLGCVTNRPYSGPQFHDEVDGYGIRDYFDVFSISCDVGYMKPHPEIFRHALEAIDVAPEDAVMVGDSLRADVQGAQRLGMTAVWRRHDAIDEDIDDVVPDFVIHDLSELPGLPCFRPEWRNGHSD